jgi:hypothetical protein
MFSARLPMLALLGSVGYAVAVPSRADTIAAPHVPPAPVNPDVPPQASAAIIVLREACAAWQPTGTVAAPGIAGSVPKPVPAPPAPPERTLREVAANSGQALPQPMIMSGIAGAIPFFIGLLVFSLLRGLLISVWNWRLPIGAKSW